MDHAAPLMPEVVMCPDTEAALHDADAAVIVTEWDVFRKLELARIRELLAAPVLVDLRNIFAPDEARAAGFQYSSIGRS
jgi:UDPglucose 6-dehydrogenase